MYYVLHGVGEDVGGKYLEISSAMQRGSTVVTTSILVKFETNLKVYDIMEITRYLMQAYDAS